MRNAVISIIINVIRNMSENMDWTKISTDPNNVKAMQDVHDHLLGMRVVKEFTYLDWIVDKVQEKNVSI